MNGLADQFFDRSQLFDFINGAKRNRDPFCSRASGPAHPVYITFCFHGHVVVNNVRDTVDVDASRCDIGRNQHLYLEFAKRFQRSLSRVLCFVAVDCGCWDSGTIKLLGEPVCAVFSSREHNRLADAIFIQDLFQFVDFV